MGGMFGMQKSERGSRIKVFFFKGSEFGLPVGWGRTLGIEIDEEARRMAGLQTFVWCSNENLLSTELERKLNLLFGNCLLFLVKRNLSGVSSDLGSSL
jgi:hypothetical protein